MNFNQLASAKVNKVKARAFLKKNTFKIILANTIFSQYHIDLLFGHSDLRYDKKTLSEIVDDMADDMAQDTAYGYDPNDIAMIRRVIALLPKDAYVIDDSRWA